MKVTVNILRHGIAEDASKETSDADRALTAAGKRKLAAVLKRARVAGVAPQLILTSSLVRAMQTAHIAGAALGVDEAIRQTDKLLPNASPADTWSELRSLASQGELLVVGHEPHLSRLAVFLLGAPGLRLDLKKGGLIRIRIENAGPKPHGILEWILTPRLAK